MDEKTYEFVQDAIEGGVVSDCCGAQIVMGDICMDCREHCGMVNEETGEEILPY